MLGFCNNNKNDAMMIGVITNNNFILPGREWTHVMSLLANDVSQMCVVVAFSMYGNIASSNYCAA
jgi:hypothetical protein